MSATQSTWTVDLVQQHAQSAVAVELYTLPFYLTALTSIQDTSATAYTEIMGVCMEEMLHLELAANLCLALGTKPNFQAPAFGTPIQFLDPSDPETGNHALINAVLGPLNGATLTTMLDIETPEQLETFNATTPQHPYSSIGAFYKSLIDGIRAVGDTNFPWTTTNQQYVWNGFSAQPFSEMIANLQDAIGTVDVISEQGEGKRMSVVPLPPFTPEQFPIPLQYQLSDPGDPSTQNDLSHFGRFLAIQNAPLPAVYTGVSSPDTQEQSDAIARLKGDFASLIDNLNLAWAGTKALSFDPMKSALVDAAACWQLGVIPQWS
jgi:hypothetical protein